MDNRYGRLSELNIEISCKEGRTILSDVYFTPPFKIMKPFYEKGLMRILQMSASPGIMEGDCQRISVDVKTCSVAEIYSQSFEKIHKMEKGEAVRAIDINVAENSFFIYNPLPTIPYAHSAFKNTITVNLKDSFSVFIYSDILTGGRIARGECFDYRYYHSLVKIYENGSLSYIDNSRFTPDEMNMKGIGIYEGYTHLLSIVICNINIYDDIENIFNDYNMPFGISKNERGYIVVRVLGKSAERLGKISDEIKGIAYIKYKNEILS